MLSLLAGMLDCARDDACRLVISVGSIATTTSVLRLSLLVYLHAVHFCTCTTPSL